MMDSDRAGTRLTQEGEIFLQFAKQSTDALRHGRRSLRAGGTTGAHLSVGVLPSVASRLLPRAVLSFSGTNPDTVLERHEGPHHDLASRLPSGKLDLVVGRLGKPESMQGPVFPQLYGEEVAVVAAPDSPAVTVWRFEDLSAFRVLHPSPDSAIRPLIARGVPLFGNRIGSSSADFGRALTLADPGTLWVISRSVVQLDIAQGRLVRLDIDTSATMGAVGVMSLADKVPTSAFRAFSTALQRAADAH